MGKRDKGTETDMHGGLAVVGVGLLGGSVALAARRRGLGRVVGIDRDAETLEHARRRGLVDDVSTELRAAADAELVVFCTPVDRIPEQALELAPLCRTGTVLTDVGSTKADIVRRLEGRLPADVAFVGGHPLAGSEKQGHGHANADLFLGRCVLLTPTSSAPEWATQRVEAFWHTLGATVRRMTPEEHDRAMALTSHLPHLVASALAGTLPPELADLTATGFRDTTRLAAGGPELWSAIFASNRDALLEALGRFTEHVERFRTALEANDFTALAELLRQGKRLREGLTR
jgi:prephenate dehydrogenase